MLKFACHQEWRNFVFQWPSFNTGTYRQIFEKKEECIDRMEDTYIYVVDFFQTVGMSRGRF